MAQMFHFSQREKMKTLKANREMANEKRIKPQEKRNKEVVTSQKQLKSQISNKTFQLMKVMKLIYLIKINDS